MSMPTATIAQHIRERADGLAAKVVDLHYSRHPQLRDRYGERGRRRCLEDANFHLRYLASALDVASPSLFLDYLAWLKCLLVQRGIPGHDLEANLQCMTDVLQDDLPARSHAPLQEYLQAGISRLPDLPTDCATVFDPQSPLASLREQYLQLLLAGRRHEAGRTVLRAADEGVSIERIYLEVFQPVQYEIGRLWQLNQITVGQEHFCTAVTQSLMAQFYPRLFATPRAGRRAVVASVGGDLHEVGGRMVADLLELNGWDAIYLGASTPTEGIARMVTDHDPQVVALSVTMTYHLRQLHDTVSAIRSRPECGRTRILVGGRPFLLEPELWRAVGADACARDGRDAVATANALIGRPSQ